MDENTKISDLTVGEFRILMKDIMYPKSPAQKAYEQQVALGLRSADQQSGSINMALALEAIHQRLT